MILANQKHGSKHLKLLTHDPEVKKKSNFDLKLVF